MSAVAAAHADMKQNNDSSNVRSVPFPPSASAADLYATYGHVDIARLQHHFTAQHDAAAVLQHQKAAATKHERIRIKSCSNRRASAWLTCIPKDPQRQLTNQQFAVAVRTRLNLPPSASAPSTCVCSTAHKIDVHSSPSHLAWCPKARSRGCTVRHNAVVDALANVARAAGIQPFVEPRELPKAGDDEKKRKRSRPDIIMYGVDGAMLVDVSILHPLAPRYVESWRDDHIDGEQRIIKQRELRKTHQHHQLAADIGDDARVAPFVIDALGAFGKEADQLLGWLARCAVGSGAFSKEQSFMTMATAVVATALQRGNSRLVNSELPRMRALVCGARLAARR